MRLLLILLMAYPGSRLLFNLFDFDYRLFREPFDPIKLTIDLGVFMALCFLGRHLLGMLDKHRANNNAPTGKTNLLRTP